MGRAVQPALLSSKTDPGPLGYWQPPRMVVRRPQRPGGGQLAHSCNRSYLTTPQAWTFALNTESTYDWENNDWSVPINFRVSKLVKFGEQPVSFGVGARYWAESSENGPDGWGSSGGGHVLVPEIRGSRDFRSPWIPGKTHPFELLYSPSGAQGDPGLSDVSMALSAYRSHRN